jgi:hypothetical protein
MYSESVLQTAIFFETPEEMFARVFREFRPRTPLPRIQVKYCKFANANSSVRWDESGLEFRITDVLEGAPSTILESLANILMAKLLRRPVQRLHTERYRRYLNRKEMRRSLQLVKQSRGRKFLSGPQGASYDLAQIFEELNAAHFHGWMAQPLLGWSRQPSRVMLGHYDPSHNAIILSRLLDSARVPRLAVEYVMFHEMLHLRFPVEHRGARRCVHTREFKAAEQEFPRLTEAKQMLKSICG